MDDDGSCTCGDAHNDDVNTIEKHPRINDWPFESTTEHSKIQEWVDTYCQVNWAIVCRTSLIVALDVDPRNGGTDARAELKKSLGSSWVPTFTVVTGLYETGDGPERGLHFYFQATPYPKFHANLGKSFPGIDIKYNGYVLALGSKHNSGVKYEVVEPLDVATIPEERSYMVLHLELWSQRTKFIQYRALQKVEIFEVSRVLSTVLRVASRSLRL